MKRSLALGLLPALVAVSIPLAARAETPECEWLAGDFHVHTVVSHDVWEPAEGPSDEFYTYGWTAGQQGAIAESRELDFVAITDHDSIDAQNNPGVSGWGQQKQLPGGDPLVWVKDYENSIGGHAQMHGADHIYDDSLGVPVVAEQLRADGGAFQINHPSDMDWHDAAGNFEYPGFAPDALEVWNIGVWAYEPPMPATNDHEFPLEMWNDFLDQGFHVAGTGGSDSHWRATTSAQGVGQPTTWVCATERSQEAILAAVRANRTSISHQPPAFMGARAYLFADNDGEPGFESMIGDTVAPGSAIEVEVENAAGATLRLVTDGGETLVEERITSFDFSKTYDVPAEGVSWLRAEVFYEDALEQRHDLQPLCDFTNQYFPKDRDKRNAYCENRLAMVAMTSPIYFEQADFDPTTTLTYVGDTSVRAGSRATFAALLSDSNGDPLAGQTVTFTFRGATLSATTDETGRAEVHTHVTGPPGQEIVHVDFAGTDTYSPSHLEQIVTVTSGRR